MKSGAKILACTAGGLALCLAAGGAPEGSNNPYEDIITRNVFALKPPPPPPSPEDTKPPPSKIILTGITTVPEKLALMKTAATPGTKPGEKPTAERFYTLRIGERDGEIEVVGIDEKAGSVKVLNAGQEELLTFEKNGVKLAATPPPTTPGFPGGLPGVPPPPGSLIQPVIKPGESPAAMPAFPSRMIRSTTATPGGVTPGFGAVTPNYGTVPAQQQPRVQLTPEETSVIMEVERQRLINKGSPNAMIMPPTALSPRGTVPGGTPNPIPQ